MSELEGGLVDTKAYVGVAVAAFFLGFIESKLWLRLRDVLFPEVEAPA